MKRYVFIVAMFGWIGSGCSNHEMDMEETKADMSQIQVTAGITQSRVSYNDKGGYVYAYWENGDAITLNTPSQGNLNYTAIVSADDATSAVFEPEGKKLKYINEALYACYPAAAINDGIVELPATCQWKDTQTLPFAYAISEINSTKVKLSFRHVFAYLQLTLTAKSLEEITGTDGSNAIHRLLVTSSSKPLGVVSGTFNFKDQSLNIVEGTNEINVILENAFNPANEEERVLYVPVLPVSEKTELNIYALHEHGEGCDTLIAFDCEKTLQKECVYAKELRTEAEIVRHVEERSEISSFEWSSYSFENENDFEKWYYSPNDGRETHCFNNYYYDKTENMYTEEYYMRGGTTEIKRYIKLNDKGNVCLIQDARDSRQFFNYYYNNDERLFKRTDEFNKLFTYYTWENALLTTHITIDSQYSVRSDSTVISYTDFAVPDARYNVNRLLYSYARESSAVNCALSFANLFGKFPEKLISSIVSYDKYDMVESIYEFEYEWNAAGMLRKIYIYDDDVKNDGEDEYIELLY